jgi:Domain of unknown function (DUF4282)
MVTLRDSVLIDPVAVKERRKPSFFGFDIFITPLLVKLAFIIGVIGCIVGGCVILRATWLEVAGRPDRWEHIWWHPLFWGGLGYIFLGPIVIRVWCESAIVIFKIFEELRRR